METYEVLERALSLIEDEENWCGDGWGSEIPSSTEGICSLQAIARVRGFEPYRSPDSASPEYRALFAATGGIVATIGEFNDSHTHGEVVALFKAAIRSEKAKAGVPIDLPTAPHPLHLGVAP